VTPARGVVHVVMKSRGNRTDRMLAPAEGFFVPRVGTFATLVSTTP
jgi:hypothetical protein